MTRFIHINSTRNIGDLVSSPKHYFRFPDAPKWAIYGGGSIQTMVDGLHANERPWSIPWGVGRAGNDDAPADATVGFPLYGSREWGQDGTTWVPCASCMSPLFDRERQVLVDAVWYYNAERPRETEMEAQHPSLPNTVNLDTALAYLASGRVVLTNSYHGAYWGILLGRKVVLHQPYSRKGLRFKHMPELMPEGRDLDAAIEAARAYPEALSECRAANAAFYERAFDLIEAWWLQAQQEIERAMRANAA